MIIGCTFHDFQENNSDAKQQQCIYSILAQIRDVIWSTGFGLAEREKSKYM